MKNAVALGTFDGVHIGHRKVLDLPKDYKKTVVTFKIPPKADKSNFKKLLMLPNQKEECLKNLGIDQVYTMDFQEVKDIEALDFLNFIKNEFNPSLISCGFNYRFGNMGKGNTELLSDFCGKENIILNITDEVKQDNITVSSSKIREFIAKGKIKQANCFLGRNFSFAAEVIKGDRRGRTLGFPTINQRYPNKLVIPRFGVYETIINIKEKKYKGITNIGRRPTFETDYIISETYIYDFQGDLYGENIKIELINFIRDEVKFNSSESLKEQVNKDILGIIKKG